MVMNIKFTLMRFVPEEFYPKPAKNVLPEWYKDTENYMGNVKQPNIGQGTTKTIKQCMPVFDSLTSGYIIPLPCDIWVDNPVREDGTHKPLFSWANFDLIEYHSQKQAEFHPMNNGLDIPKIMSPWSIRTPKGYSCIFQQPFNRESPITILPGIVDTDHYFSPVNFPFVLTDETFHGLIPAGTPLVQVIPFRRENWTSEVSRSNRDIESADQNSIALHTRFFHSYKNQFWSRKSFK